MNHEKHLQAMGIQTWQLREASAEAPQQPSTENPPVKLDWEALRACISQCTKCPLHQTRTQTVFGVGNPQADLMIIGEAPGASEDEQGEPFVGRAGLLLNEMLAAIGLQRDDVFIANILKCRPPNNRDPQKDEVDTCTPYLLQQIESIQPKLIVTVGRIAAQFLLETTTTLGKLRNQVHQYQNTPLIATYHPAYLLRAPREKIKSWQDWQAIREQMKRMPTA